ncbi:MAG TPA: hypothetical protein VE998_11290 [Terriglobales bacterium]|nr:hypothetical protein [Terriglobales bacterium]
MFLRKLQVDYETEAGRQPCPLKWLDNFAMRNFTNDPAFDATLPVADGQLEAGSRVPLDRLRHDMEDWFRRKGYLPPGARVTIQELRKVTVS